MFEEDIIKSLMNKIFKLSPARATEVNLYLNDGTLIRFADNRVVLTLNEFNGTASIRILHGNRMGRAATNKFDDSSLAACCEKALQLAKNAAPDPDALPLAGAQTYQPVEAYFEATGATSAYQLAAQVDEMLALAREHKASLSGVNQVERFAYAVGNSQGLLAITRGTRARASTTATLDGATGFAIAEEPDIRNLDHQQLAQTSLEKAALARNARELPPGEYTALLEPQAVANLLVFLLRDYVSQISPFSGTAFLKKQGFVAHHFKEKFFGENFSLHDDVYHPLQQGIPFDGEGMPRKRVTLVEKGVITGLVHSRSSALKMSEEPTGHGLEMPTAFGAMPMHLIMEGGEASIDELMREMRNGIRITRFWYNRLVDSNTMTVTGMTRDGTYLVKRGKIAAALKNMRFNESLFHVFNHITALGKPVRTVEEETGLIMVVPPICVEGFHFTGRTLF